jgi:hypothetical protein
MKTFHKGKVSNIYVGSKDQGAVTKKTYFGRRGNLASVLKTAETIYFIFLNIFFSFIIKKQFV